TPSFLSPGNWEEIRDQNVGLEIRFHQKVPFSILQTVFQLKGDMPLDTEVVSNIWIFVNKDNDEVRTFFQTEYSYYEARADLNSKNVEQMVGFGELRGHYYVFNRFYLPADPIEIAKHRIAVDMIPIDQLQKSLFVDPGNTRNFRNR